MVRLALFAFALASFLPAQTKVAVINSQLAVIETAEIKKVQTELEAKYKPRQEQMAKLQKEIADLENQLRAGQGKLTPQAQQDMQLTGQRKQRELQRLSEDVQGEVDRERQEILSRTGNQMQAIVKKLAEERAFDIVVDVSNTVYFKPALDITKEATDAYDKAYPVK
jgi:outer membrane protein